MTESFEDRDLVGAEFWGVDLNGARFRDADFTNVKISHARLVDVEIDAFIDNVSVNGVDVTAYVNDRDPWYPIRAMLRPPDLEGMRTTWDALADLWATTTARASQLAEPKLYESVNEEWSFVETLRHLVFAMDKWFTAPILGEPFHPIGLPNSGSAEFPWPGLDRDAAPTFAEVVAARAERSARLRDYLMVASSADLTPRVEVLENGTTMVHDCVGVVFEEEFEHNRYATRDLARLE